jgi:hypothetical protein
MRLLAIVRVVVLGRFYRQTPSRSINAMIAAD